MSGNLWTEQENENLRKLYSTGTREEIMRAIPGRSWVAIEMHAYGGHISRGTSVGQPLRRSIKPINKIEPVDGAWLASAIDGEGSITLCVEDKVRNLNGSWSGFIRVFNTNLDYVQRAKEIIGRGTIHSGWQSFSIGDRRRGKACLMHMYSLHGIRAVAQVLRQIEPFLIIKRDRAEIIIRIARLLEAQGPWLRRADARFLDLYWQFRGLVHRAKRVRKTQRTDIAKWLLC